MELGNPYILLRLGQLYFERNDVDKVAVTAGLADREITAGEEWLTLCAGSTRIISAAPIQTNMA